MQRALTLYSTSVGKKVAMALSGAILVGFAIVHFAGNLNLYAGQEAFNGYALKLREIPALLWAARLALIFAFGTHFVTYVMLVMKNMQARPVRYAKKKDMAQDYASKTMYLTGPMLLFFVLYHLAHMTFGQTFGVYEWVEENPYDNLVHGFQHLPVVIPYVLGVLCLGTHIFHGIYSAFQSIGANHPKYNHLRRDLAIGIATLITIGNLSYPISVQAGWIKPSDAALTGEGMGDSGTVLPLPIPGQ